MNQKAYLVDMGGVIYRENQLLPGAEDFVIHLLKTATPFLFVTNKSAPTPEDLVVKLKHLGIGELRPPHFYTSAINTADVLAGLYPKCIAFLANIQGKHADRFSSFALQTLPKGEHQHIEHPRHSRPRPAMTR